MRSKLWPFFCYFGGKWRAAPHYPVPQHDEIFEPFAGAAGYATRYHDRRITLHETDPKIFGIWDFLLRASESDINSIPSSVGHVNEISGPQEARWLVGFWLNKATTTPHLTPSAWMRQGWRPNSQWGDAIKQRIASQLAHVRHWKILNRSYVEAENRRATWFIDPPYQGESGRRYSHNAIDFGALANYCRTRDGQVIVCEQAGADWLPFETFRTIKAVEGKHGKKKSHEVIYHRISQPVETFEEDF